MSLTLNASTGQVIISRGDDGIIRYTVKNSSGVAYDVSANSFAFTVKTSIDDAIGDAKFQLTNPAASGIDLTSAASGIVDVKVRDTDTSALAGAYQYDLQMTESGLIYTLAQGMFVVRKDVTTPGVAGTSSALVAFPGGFYVGSGGFYLLDVVTGLYSGFRLESGVLVQSSTQSATVPFTY
jgi:hypothetical protein